MRPLAMVMTVSCVVLVSAAGCGGADEPAAEVPESITVTSTAFQQDQAIPQQYTCDGAGVSPPLAWQGVPAEAKAVALVVDDPDAPSGTYVHWVVLDIPAGTASIEQGRSPAGARQADNSAGKAAYAGPCPPSGTHHYRFTVYALKEPTGLKDGAGTDEALVAVDKATIARGRLTGTYQRQG